MMKVKIRKIHKKDNILKLNSAALKSHQRNKHLVSPPCNVLWTILNMEKGIIQGKGHKDKEIKIKALGLSPER